MTNVRKNDKRRFSLSILAAFFLHCVLFVAFVRLIPLSLKDAPEYTGPISVTVGEFEEAAPEAKPAGARGGQPAEQPVAEKQAPRKRGWERPASPRAQDDSDRLEVIKNLVPVPAEQSADVAAPKLTPEMVKQNEKKLPFEPKTELSETPLALDLRKLDETLDTTKRDDRGSSIRKPAEPAPGKAGPGRGTGPAAGTGPKQGAGTASGSLGSPVISWEDAGVQRLLLSGGPPPDIPQWVKREGIDLKVVVSFSVTAGGQTTLVSTALSSGYTDVDSAVLDSVRKMKFNPVPGTELARGSVSYIIRTK